MHVFDQCEDFLISDILSEINIGIRGMLSNTVNIKMLSCITCFKMHYYWGIQ